jgi:magnesium-transporting ATPase (P-type)
MKSNNEIDKAISAILILMLIALILTFGLSLFKIPPPILIEKPPIEKFLWSYRGIDMLIQAFLILAAAAAVSTLFRIEKGKGAIEEAVIENLEEKKEEK